MKNAHHLKFSLILITFILLTVSVATPSWMIASAPNSISGNNPPMDISLWDKDNNSSLDKTELDIVRSFSVIGPLLLFGAALMVYLNKKNPIVTSMMILMGVISSGIVVGLWAKGQNQRASTTPGKTVFGYSYFVQIAGLSTGAVALGVSYLKNKKK